MGYIRHHAIAVTTWDRELGAAAHRMASEIFPSVSSLLDSEINGYVSFFIAPDGSKEGWEESDTGDNRREKFVAWLDGKRYCDGSSPLAWAEIQYGDDEHQTKIVRHSDERKRRKIRRMVSE